MTMTTTTIQLTGSVPTEHLPVLIATLKDLTNRLQTAHDTRTDPGPITLDQDFATLDLNANGYIETRVPTPADE